MNLPDGPHKATIQTKNGPVDVLVTALVHQKENRWIMFLHGESNEAAEKRRANLAARVASAPNNYWN